MLTPAQRRRVAGARRSTCTGSANRPARRCAEQCASVSPPSAPAASFGWPAMSGRLARVSVAAPSRAPESTHSRATGGPSTTSSRRGGASPRRRAATPLLARPAIPCGGPPRTAPGPRRSRSRSTPRDGRPADDVALAQHSLFTVGAGSTRRASDPRAQPTGSASLRASVCREMPRRCAASSLFPPHSSTTRRRYSSSSWSTGMMPDSSRGSSNLRSFACAVSGRSPISSRKSVPRSASSTRPCFYADAVRARARLAPLLRARRAEREVR